MSLLEWSIWPWIAAIVGFFGGGVFAITQAVSGHVRNFRADLEASGEETHADRRLNAANALIAPSWWSYYLKGLRSGLDILNRWMGTLREPGRGFAWCLAAAFIYPISLLLTGWLFGGPAAIGATEMLPPADQLPVLRRLLLVAWTIMVGVAFFLIVRNAERIDDWWQARLDRLLFDRVPDSHRNTAKRALLWAIGLVVFAILYGWLGLPLVIAAAVAAAVAAAAAAAAAVAVAAAGAVAAWLSGTSLVEPWITTWVLFWALLPLLNAFLDWLSWMISRGLGNNLLRISEADDVGPLWRVWIYSRDIAIDIIAACALLVGLAWSLPRVIELWNGLVRMSGAETPLDLDDYLCAAAAAPLTDGLWATGMLFSTLIPTVLHLSVVAVAPLIWIVTPTETARTRAGHIAFGFGPPACDLGGVSAEKRQQWPSMPQNFGKRLLPEDADITTERLHPATVSAVAWTLRFKRVLFFAITCIVVAIVVWQLGALAGAAGRPLPQLLLYVASNFDYAPVRQCFPEALPTAPFETLAI